MRPYLCRVLVPVLILAGLFAALFAGLCTPLVQAQAIRPQALHYGYPDQFVLTQKHDANGEPSNPLLRVAEFLTQQSNTPMTSATYPAARLFQRLHSGSVTFTLLVNAPQLEACCITSRKPIYSTTIRVYRWQSEAAVTSPSDLIGKRIITLRGYSYGQLKHVLEDPVNRIIRYATDTHRSAFSMLAVKRAHYLLDYAGPAEEILQAQPIPGVTYDTLTTVPIYIVLNKNVPNAEDLMQHLETIAESVDIAGIIARNGAPVSGD